MIVTAEHGAEDIAAKKTELEEKLTDQGVQFGGAVLPVDRATLSDTDQSTVTVGVRPEDLELVGDEQGIAVEVDVVEELGADAYVYGHATIGGEERLITLRTVGYTAPEKGSVVHVVPDPERVHLFHAETGERLNR